MYIFQALPSNLYPINYLLPHNLLRPHPYIVHLSNPLHLIRRLKFFRHALNARHLLHQLVKCLLRPFLNSQQMFHKRTIQYHPCINPLVPFLQITLSHQPELSKLSLRLWICHNIWHQIISILLICYVHKHLAFSDHPGLSVHLLLLPLHSSCLSCPA